MFEIINAYNKLRNNLHLNNNEVSSIMNNGEIESFQYASLAIQLTYINLNKSEKILYEFILNKYKQIELWILEITGKVNSPNNLYSRVLHKTVNKENIGKEDINTIISKYMDGDLNLDFLGAWLMLICIFDMGLEDTLELTSALLKTGNQINYKDKIEQKNAFFLRRYPTGGVSEKTALILPSLLAAASDEHSIKANFLIAKTLGFTGGTIDKLSIFKNFKAPSEEKEIIDILNNFNIIMSSTGSYVAPADKKMYSFRSITGTVESIPLIVASIASKQLALPTDFLLVDIRYGLGAFVEDKVNAKYLGEYLNDVLRKYNLISDYVLTNADYPTGSSIGNVTEVLEALEIMNPNEIKPTFFNHHYQIVQKEIVLDFFEILMNRYENQEKGYWRNYGLKLFNSGKVLDKFLHLLLIHGVSEETIQLIKVNPRNILDNYNAYNILPEKYGVIKNINFKEIGYYTNYLLNRSQVTNQKLDNGGIILNCFVGNKIKKGDKLCTVYTKEELSINDIEEIRNYFIVE